MERKAKTVILGIIENEAGEILMTERLDPKVKAAHKRRDVPGGMQEPGEEQEETLLREIREEIGVEVDIIRKMPEDFFKSREHDDYIQDISLRCYVCRIKSGTPESKDPKIGKIQRVHIDKIFELDMLETTEFFLKKYIERK